MTQGQVNAYCLRSREPWREYFPYRPDDMPPKRGNPERLAKLLAEYGADETEGDDDGTQ